MIGIVSTGRCPMPPVRDRSGMQFNFFADLWNFRPKVIILSSSSEIFLQGNEIRYQKDPIFWMIKFCFLSRYKRDDMGAGYCTPHQTEKVIFCLFFLHIFRLYHYLWRYFIRASPAVAMVIVLETLSALAAEPVQISNKESFHIFSDSKYAKRLNSAVSNEYLYLLTTSSCVNRVGDFVKPEPFENEIKENRKSLTFRCTLSLHCCLDNYK